MASAARGMMPFSSAEVMSPSMVWVFPVPVCP